MRVAACVHERHLRHAAEEGRSGKGEEEPGLSSWAAQSRSTKGGMRTHRLVAPNVDQLTPSQTNISTKERSVSLSQFSTALMTRPIRMLPVRRVSGQRESAAAMNTKATHAKSWSVIVLWLSWTAA